MNKTPSLFTRDFDQPNNPLTLEVSPQAAWVLRGEGTPTRKYDGTCVLLDENGDWWARREVKAGKNAPPNFLSSQTDDATGKTMGWEPIEQTGLLKHHQEAIAGGTRSLLDNNLPAHNYVRTGTYELCGPKVNGNPEGFVEHVLIYHKDAEKLVDPGLGALTTALGELDPQTRFNAVKATVLGLGHGMGWEGIVWHHRDGRYVKIKASDFK